MIASLARFANDSYCLTRTPHSIRTKALLWFNLLYPSRKMLGFEVNYFDRPTLRHLYREIFVRQYYYCHTSTEAPVIFDCGANLGMATLYFKWLYPRAQIHAFEPDPDTFSLLQRNIARNHLSDVMCHNCALWNDNGEIDFFVHDSFPGSLLMSTERSRANGKAIHVISRKLSDFIEGPVDLIKLDVEGGEHRVICDLVTSNKISLVKHMVIEYHHRIANQGSRLASFLRMLEKSGFEYQIQASLYPVTSKDMFQDMLIGAYRSALSQRTV
jgi:FkbM family methyltransferase